MIEVEKLYQLLKAEGIEFFSGVPDSLLKDFCAYLMDHVPSCQHVIAANEGNALAAAAGHYLATGRAGMVYLQNSGLGNLVNPMTSLVDPLVYQIPVLLLVGWRGQPGIKDEPQHLKQGKITLELLETLGVEYGVLPRQWEDAEKMVRDALEKARERKTPYALVVEKDTFSSYRLQKQLENNYQLSREEAIENLLSHLEESAVVVSTTGKISRELFELRKKRDEGHGKDFLTVGSMGHSSQIALGIALSRPDRMVYCLDGDGAVLMHMGSLGITGSHAPANFKHLVLNNGAHDSVGGQPTSGFDVDVPAVAGACGYRNVYHASTREELMQKMELLKKAEGPALLEVRVAAGARKDLGRPTTTPQENKKAFMQFLSG